jgi:hypothetical protein
MQKEESVRRKRFTTNIPNIYPPRPASYAYQGRFTVGDLRRKGNMSSSKKVTDVV